MRYREHSAWCRRCQAYRPVGRPAPDPLKHALACVLTLGLWLPGWGAAWWLSRRAGWRCGRCGSHRLLPRREFQPAGARDLCLPAAPVRDYPADP